MVPYSLEARLRNKQEGKRASEIGATSWLKSVFACVGQRDWPGVAWHAILHCKAVLYFGLFWQTAVILHVDDPPPLPGIALTAVWFGVSAGAVSVVHQAEQTWMFFMVLFLWAKRIIKT